MKKIMKVGVFTADDEIPNCFRCDNVVDASDEFCDECMRNFWKYYQRSDYVEIEVEGK